MEEGIHLPGVEHVSVLLGDLNNIISENDGGEHVELVFMKAREALFNSPQIIGPFRGAVRKIIKYSGEGFLWRNLTRLIL